MTVCDMTMLLTTVVSAVCSCNQAAGGVSHDGQGSILDLVINDTGARSIIALGSAPQVQQCLDAMRGA
jgi:fructose-1,6-bisphosphatase